MAYNDIVNVAISLDVAAVSRAGFGVLLYAAPHTAFSTRVRSYTKLDDVAKDFQKTSDTYIALQGAFSSETPPSLVKVGRQEVSIATYTPEAPTAIGTLYQIDYIATDGSVISITYTSVGSDTPSLVAAGLNTSAADVQGVAFTVVGDDLIATITQGDEFTTTGITSTLTVAYTATETIVDAISLIVNEDNDFYFFATPYHDETTVLAIAADMETRTKIYFVALGNPENLIAQTSPAASDDIIGKLKELAYYRTSAWFHDEADTVFPECNYITLASPSDPGKKIWANNRISGSDAARDGGTLNLLLSAGQKGILNDKSANYTEVVGGITISRRGTVSGGETFLLSLIRARDFLIARVTESYQNFLINSPVVPYTNTGIASTRNVLATELGRYVETDTQPNILQKEQPFTISFPRRSDISSADIAAGIYAGTFTAYLSGAIREIAITGSLTYQAS